MGVSDFSILADLIEKVRSLMADLSSPSPSSCEEGLMCYDFNLEMDRDVNFGGPHTPVTQVVRSGRNNVGKFAGRQLFTATKHLTVSTERLALDEEEEEESDKQFFTPLSENLNLEYSDSDSTSMTNSPTKDESTPKSDSNFNFENSNSNFDFESDSLWLPPDPEENQFNYDSSEDENEIKINFDSKLHVHFKALVAQLLDSEGVKSENENYEGWIEIVAMLTWQAACFVKPDLRKGGSMDPGDYVKIKCISSGQINDSKFVKGIVCSKNVKHKRMISQHTNPRLLLLGGSLEYQKLSPKLASINHVLQQEKEQLKRIVDKISLLKPNVLLVEKTAPLMAQEILSNEISLVLNVKKPLLDRIARCTGASIVSSVEGIGSAKLGYCQRFRTQKVTEMLPTENPNGRANNKTLMFFEGCPRPLGCTVLLRGGCIEELKKVKKVVQLAIFAAYHLLLETSFLADEGASIPRFPSRNGSNGSFHNWNQTQIDANNSSNYNSNNNNNNDQSILVSKSSSCVNKGTICELAHIFRIKFYGRFDKPLGRYLCEDLFDEAKSCPACKGPPKSHIKCYTHQQGTLTIYVRKIKDLNEKLSGEREGKIWMWHRCIKCDPLEEMARPATRRVAMSDAAWGLSFGKFLELSFCNHSAANRVAPCGHSFQRDCLRFYGFGSMVALFKYTPVDILTVSLPPSILEATCDIPQEWIIKEATMIYNKVECLHAEVSHLIFEFEKNNSFSQDDPLMIGPHNYLIELKDLLKMERNNYDVLLRPFLTEEFNPYQSNLDIMELNKLKQGLLLDSYTWDRRICHLSTVLKANPKPVSFLPQRNSLLSQQLEASSPCKLEMSSRHLDESSSCLSDQIDSAWTGSGRTESEPVKLAPVRIHSFDSSVRIRRKLFASSRFDPLTLTSVNSVDSFGTGDLEMPNMRRAFSHKNPREIQNSNFGVNSPVYITSVKNSLLSGPRFLQNRYEDELVVPVYDDEPTSIIAYALTILPEDIKETHFRISFEDETLLFPSDKAKFSVNFYFPKKFENLREKCGLNEADFVKSLSRCKRWSAKGGKSKVYFAKTLDERFIVKQVTKTELDSFEEFAPNYFKYLNESLSSQNHSCLVKIFGIYQVCVKNMRGRETKMDVMIMENLFYKRNISRVYDLKGSVRSRYISDASGDNNKVLLDMNLLEALQKNPIFLGSFAKRQLERAVWNDTSFLAAVDVMDYSLLVGIDEDKKELVVGIIDFMRQYTWDKQLETWVKASGILGGPKNASPTIISPIQYKKRFRKAMSKYFQTIPDVV